MGIEKLNKAASAAGYAMATPDDDANLVETSAEEQTRSDVRALVPINAQSRFRASETFLTVSSWAKSVLPTWGGRQPA